MAKIMFAQIFLWDGRSMTPERKFLGELFGVLRQIESVEAAELPPSDTGECSTVDVACIPCYIISS
jgi:hypothetical protein